LWQSGCELARSYGHAIDEFIGWYCTEPRLSFHRTVVPRYRFFLEHNLAPSTINVRLAAVRCLAYEASDTGLLSPDLAAGFRRVKGAKRLGVRNGNWWTIDQSRSLFGNPLDSLRGKRDRAILALLIGCGLGRAELVGLRTGDFQVRKIIFARDPGSISQWFLPFKSLSPIASIRRGRWAADHIPPAHIKWCIFGQPKTNRGSSVSDGFGRDGGSIVRMRVFVIVNRPF